MFWGEVDEFDQSWRDYAERNPNIEIIFMKFEDFLKDKNSHIEKLSEFIGFKNPSIDEIIENSTLEATINRRKTKWENLGCKFWEIVCYRKVRALNNYNVTFLYYIMVTPDNFQGQSGSWKEELSE